MSFDPFQEQRPPHDPAHRPALESTRDNIPDPTPPVSNARERVLFPAILLIITGVINLLVSGVCVAVGMVVTPEFFEKTLNDPNQPQIFKDALAKSANAGNMEEMASSARVQYIGIGIANILTMFFSIFAGIRMLQLRNYGLVFFGAIVAAIPCVSGASCCCVGEAAGIYAIIMLLQNEIRDAFR